MDCWLEQDDAARSSSCSIILLRLLLWRRARPASAGKSIRKLERVKGIEPSSSAWKAVALPLSYTRGTRFSPRLIPTGSRRTEANARPSPAPTRGNEFMAQPAPTIRRIAERIGGTNKVVSSTSISEVLNRTNIGCVIERMAVAPVDVPPVMGVTAVTVGIAGDWQRKHT